MSIRPVAHNASDDGRVILKIVGIGVVAFAPLGDVLVVAHTHDGCPVRVPFVVSHGRHGVVRHLPVVAQVEGVSSLMAGSLGGVFRIAIPELGGENEARRV